MSGNICTFLKMSSRKAVGGSLLGLESICKMINNLNTVFVIVDSDFTYLYCKIVYSGY